MEEKKGKKRGRKPKEKPNALSNYNHVYKNRKIPLTAKQKAKRHKIDRLVNEWFLNGNNATRALFVIEPEKYNIDDPKSMNVCRQTAWQLIHSQYARELIANKMDQIRRADDKRMIMSETERKVWLSESAYGLREEGSNSKFRLSCISELNKMEGFGNNKVTQTNVNVNLSIEDQRKALQEEFKKSFDFIEGEFKENVQIARDGQAVIGSSDTD